MPHSYFEISFSCTFVYAVAIFKATHVVPRIRALTCYCVLIGNGEQLAKSHNDDNQFSRDMSHNEQLQMMHACFIKHGGKDKSFKVKQLALKEMGVIVEKSTDPMNKKFENSWQLACHTGEIWALLSQVFKLTLEGRLKGMEAAAKKYVDPSIRDSVYTEAKQPANKKAGRQPKTPRAPMPRSHVLEDLKDRKVIVPDIKQDVWKRFLGLESKEGGSQFYIETLQRVVNRELSMHEAGQLATDFKRLAVAQADIVTLLAQPEITNCAEAEIKYPIHCTRERIDALLRSYKDFKPVKGDPSSRYPKEIR